MEVLKLFNEIPLTLNIEEEYQIGHPETRELHSYMQHLLQSGQRVLPTSGWSRGLWQAKRKCPAIFVRMCRSYMGN